MHDSKIYLQTSGIAQDGCSSMLADLFLNRMIVTIKNPKCLHSNFQMFDCFQALTQVLISQYFNICLYILKKVIAAAVAEAGLTINEKTKSFRNTKFGIKIAFLMKMCKKPSPKTKDPWGLH